MSQRDDLMTIADRLDTLQSQRDALRLALAQLVAAKDEKDANGETLLYRKIKSGAWDRARELLHETEPTS